MDGNPRCEWTRSLGKVPKCLGEIARTGVDGLDGNVRNTDRADLRFANVYVSVARPWMESSEMLRADADVGLETRKQLLICSARRKGDGKGTSRRGVAGDAVR
jgi:hypothetical protein